jgi:hypothetical protein
MMSPLRSEASAVSLFGSSLGGGAAVPGVAASPLRGWEASTPTTHRSPASTRSYQNTFGGDMRFRTLYRH